MPPMIEILIACHGIDRKGNLIPIAAGLRLEYCGHVVGGDIRVRFEGGEIVVPARATDCK